jgi:hypothetical protein
MHFKRFRGRRRDCLWLRSGAADRRLSPELASQDGASPEISLEWRVSISGSFSADTMVASGRVVAEPIKPGYLRASAVVTGLQPETRYFYQFISSTDGLLSQTGFFETSGKWTGAMHALTLPAPPAVASIAHKVNDDTFSLSLFSTSHGNLFNTPVEIL